MMEKILNEYATDSFDPIQHVVVLMLENHSFDQMLGCLQSVYPDLEGIDSAIQRYNMDNQGTKFFQTAITATQIRLDPSHNCQNVATQLRDNNAGFVQDFVTSYPDSTFDDRQNIMGYYPLDFLPALHTLAREFTICDHWFSSVPGPTWPNRFFALSGTSSGHVEMPDGLANPDAGNAIFGQNQKTIFDCLNEAGKTFKNYFYDFPLSLVLTHQRYPENLLHYHKIDAFFRDAGGSAAEFPDFTFIEPKYLDVDQNDDHPPHNTMKSEKLIADVYNAIRSNQPLWESTLLVVVYDEHGGFYDHIQPPSVVPPDDCTQTFPFDRLGVRVPALLISPWIKKGVEKTIFDHTSLLKYLIDKWSMSSLGERTSHANSIKCALSFDQDIRQDCVSFIRVPNSLLISKDIELEKWDKSRNHESIHVFADYLSKAFTSNVYPTVDLPIWASLMQKIGRILIKLGKYLEQDAYHHRKAQIARTCEIVDRTIGDSV